MASQFQRAIEDEIFQVFLNLYEFAEKGEIAGRRGVPMVVESLELELPPSSSDGREGVSYEGVTVFVAASDLPEDLLPQKAVSFKNEQWFVISASCEMGLKKIELYRERG